MSNDNQFERLFKLQATVGKLVLDGKRDPERIADIFQAIVSGSVESSSNNNHVVEASIPIEKFSLLVDLGIVTVPDDYDHATELDKFMNKNLKKFYGVNDDIIDVNFPNPTRLLKPGDKLHARAFKQDIGWTSTSKERMEFLATQKAIHTGAQGASLVFEQKRDQLPKGKWYASFDEKERLWTDADGYGRVPAVGARWDGDFDWDLCFFERIWREYDAFLCFTAVI